MQAAYVRKPGADGRNEFLPRLDAATPAKSRQKLFIREGEPQEMERHERVAC